MPLVGGGPGLRQPVHAEDLAIGAIAAAGTPVAVDKIYSPAGAGTRVTYREMIGRMFDGLKPRRTVSVPPWLWRWHSLCRSRFPGRQRGDGPAHDEGYDLRLHARESGISG